MKLRFFTFLVSFLTVMSGAVWGQNIITIEEIETKNEGFTTSGSDGAWTLSHGNEGTVGNVLEIKTPGKYIIEDNQGDGESNNSNVQIKITGTGEYNITLVNIRTDANLGNSLTSIGSNDVKLPTYPDRCAFEINPGATVTLDWKGNTKLWSGGNRAGINVKRTNGNNKAKLILKGTSNGELEAGSYCNTGEQHTHGAGIGGDSKDSDFGDIVIESGIIKAYSQALTDNNHTTSEIYADGAGIGGGYEPTNDGQYSLSKYGTILIKGGNVTAECSTVNLNETYAHGAGIGGGHGGTCESITILGGTVNASSVSGDDIGVGYNFEKNETTFPPQIIVGKWDKDTNTTVSGTEINGTNYLNALGSDPSVSGIVTMPEGTQIYMEKDPEGNGIFNAYKVLHLINSKDLKPDLDKTEYNDILMFYGKNTPYYCLDLKNASEVFNAAWANFGWVDNKGDFQSISGSGDILDGFENHYIPVLATWVVKKYPTINIAYQGKLQESISLVYPNFAKVTMDIPSGVDELIKSYGAKIEGTQIVESDVNGTANSGIKTPINLKAKGNNKEQEIALEFNVGTVNLSNANIQIKEKLIYNAETLNPILRVTNEGKDIPANVYTVKYKVKGSNDESNSPFSNVGSYQVKIVGKAPNYNGETYWVDYAIIPATLTVTFRDLTEDEIGQTLIASNWVESYSGAFDNQQPKISDNAQINVSSEPNQNGKYTVNFKGLKLVDNDPFKASNYTPKWMYGNTEINLDGNGDGQIEIEDPTGGDDDDDIIGETKYYQLYLLESDGAKLFSRNNKMRTPAGRSFTVWYEKEPGYEDCEPTVYYKRGRSGEWQVLKFDEVSEYYQIRNVFSDIYVKVSGDGIWPVSNEEVEAQEVKVYTQNGAIVVVTPSVMDVQVVSMTGSVVAADKVAGQREFRNLAEGVYIVRVGDKIVKIRL